MIEFHDFSFMYHGQERTALSHVSLSIGPGEMVLLTGPSGGGKTSLCRCLNGLIPHFHGGTLSGRVLVGGMDITEHQPREFATSVGVVFQDPENQLVGTDVERDIAFGLENLGLPPDVMAQRVDQSLAALGITALRRNAIWGLSGGEKQKTVLAGALAMRPSILVLDEPTSELDPLSARIFMHTLSRLREELQLTVLLVEHRLERCIEYCSRVVVMDEGQVVEDGDTRSVVDRLVAKPRGIGIPPVVALAAAFRLGQIWHGPMPLSVEEAQGQFGTLLPVALPVHRRVPPPAALEPLVQASNVSFCYNKGIPVLNEVSTSISPGELVAVMGRNGSGKTTLVKHLNGLLTPDTGTVRVKGIDTRNTDVAKLARTVGMVFQNPNDHLFAETVEDEIQFTLAHLKVDAGIAASAINETLERFGLGVYRGHYPRSLSGGERQRVALASVVAARPDVLVLDEPTRGLSQQMKLELMAFLRSYCAEGRTVVLVTHDVETVVEHADRVLLLEGGRVSSDGPAREVLAQSDIFRPDVNRVVLPFFAGEDAARFMTVEDVLEAFI